MEGIFKYGVGSSSVPGGTIKEVFSSHCNRCFANVGVGTQVCYNSFHHEFGVDIFHQGEASQNNALRFSCNYRWDNNEWYCVGIYIPAWIRAPVVVILQRGSGDIVIRKWIIDPLQNGFAVIIAYNASPISLVPRIPQIV